MTTLNRLGQTVRGFEVAVRTAKKTIVYGSNPRFAPPLTGEEATRLMVTMEARGHAVQARTESEWCEEFLSTEEMKGIFL